MTVSPYRGSFKLDNYCLSQFLLATHQYCQNNNCTQIVNIQIEISYVDPLVVLDRLAQTSELNFYWENQSKKEAIAALGAVAKLEFYGQDRFVKSEAFIKYCLNNLKKFSGNSQEISNFHFFCGFSFFEEINQDNYPFHPATIFLPRWQVWVKEERCFLIANAAISPNVSIQRFLQLFWKKIEIINSLVYTQKDLEFVQPTIKQKTVTNAERFQKSVSSALSNIRAGELSKIVLADALDVQSNSSFNLFKSLNNLRQLHPNCYIFSISNGQGQNFIGASPERLISINKQQLITDALAGSAPRGKTPTEDATNANRLLNSEKERHEHSLVIDFITQRLTQLGLLPQVLAPRLRQLSNIQHLWTPISAIVPANVHPLKIVAQLHPTPAVAGASSQVACAQIKRYESFERGLYAAPLGWVDESGNCEFVVGIRSALLDGNKARLYAGAGIVDGSDPQRELAEIQLKLQALLKALV